MLCLRACPPTLRPIVPLKGHDRGTHARTTAGSGSETLGSPRQPDPSESAINRRESANSTPSDGKYCHPEGREIRPRVRRHARQFRQGTDPTSAASRHLWQVIVPADVPKTFVNPGRTRRLRPGDVAVQMGSDQSLHYPSQSAAAFTNPCCGIDFERSSLSRWTARLRTCQSGNIRPISGTFQQIAGIVRNANH